MEHVTLKTFEYHNKLKLQCKIKYDLQIPLPEFVDEHDLFCHLTAQHNLPLSSCEDLKAEFNKFIVTETQKFFDYLAERRLSKILNDKDKTTILRATPYVKFINSDQKTLYISQTNDFSEPSFEEHFKHIMKTSSVKQLSRIVQEELDMSGKMLALIRARDFEIERLTKTCEVSISCPYEKDGLNNVIQGEAAIQQSYNLTMLNEKLQQISMNYCLQVEALRNSQKCAYRNFIFRTDKVKDDDHFILTEKKETKSNEQFTSSTSELQKYPVSNQSLLYGSHFASDKIDTLDILHDESFTIYIGAQMKTMHNTRILLCNKLSDLITGCLSSAIFQGFRSTINANSDECEKLFNSRRLQLLMSLYQRELTGVVLVVENDPLYHIKNQTAFAKLCEQSADLHFDSLEVQLKTIEFEIRNANRLHHRQQLNESSLDICNNFNASQNSLSCYDETILQPGDVYVTCHSNLSSAQVVFHLVIDKKLETEEISSRHACINGIHNIIRLCSRCAIQNISLPLLLVESTTETMTVSWCMSRAELVFKCLKGFLMEICVAGSTLSATAAKSSSTISSPGGTSSTTHYNINFALPSKISTNLFSQIVDLFSAIFHLVPSLSV